MVCAMASNIANGVIKNRSNTHHCGSVYYIVALSSRVVHYSVLWARGMQALWSDEVQTVINKLF